MSSSTTRRGQELLTVAEVCTELRIAKRTFYEWRAKGLAPECTRLPNRDLRVSRADLDAWMAARKEPAR